jgi:LAO/AO transport system kinase
MKSGIMEIADIFVVNKCDREGADQIANSLQKISSYHPSGNAGKPVIKTSTVQQEGLQQLLETILAQNKSEGQKEKRILLLAEKLYRIIQKKRMRDVDKHGLLKKINESIATTGSANVYLMAEEF